MKLTEKEAALEAILFTMGEAVETKRLAEAIGETPEKTRELLEKLRAGWEKEHRGVNLISLEDSWQMCTRSEFYDYLIRIAKAPKKYTLTDTLLETLSIIAYKQPVTRLDVEKIRGVNCDHAINRLVEYNLVEELGRLMRQTSAFIRHDRTVFAVVWRRLSGRAAGAVCRTGRRIQRAAEQEAVLQLQT